MAKELESDVPAIAEKFIQAYFADVSALGCKEADVHPRVTENMDEIIEFIDTLVQKGYAYESDGDVYYRTRKFDGYGKLSHQSIDDLKVGARIQVGEKKEDALDFALWKMAKEGEIAWDSPWGKGRPGVHGVKGDLGGILNVRQWRRNTLEIRLIFMLVGKI